MSLRLAPDQMRDLERTARRRGQTKQSFVEGAILREIAEDNERRHLKKLGNSDNNATRRSTNTSSSTAGGLGIAETMRQRRVIEDEISPTPAAAPVVVNVGGGISGASNADLFERLASYVLAGNDFERDSRIRNAVGMLHASATSEEERKVLAARLDEVVATKAKTKTNNGGVVRVARVAFDKLSGIFGDNE